MTADDLTSGFTSAIRLNALRMGRPTVHRPTDPQCDLIHTMFGLGVYYFASNFTGLEGGGFFLRYAVLCFFCFLL